MNEGLRVACTRLLVAEGAFRRTWVCQLKSLGNFHVGALVSVLLKSCSKVEGVFDRLWYFCSSKAQNPTHILHICEDIVLLSPVFPSNCKTFFIFYFDLARKAEFLQEVSGVIRTECFSPKRPNYIRMPTLSRWKHLSLGCSAESTQLFSPHRPSPSWIIMLWVAAW